MPYIKKHHRAYFDGLIREFNSTLLIKEVGDKNGFTAGDFNYLITKFIQVFLNEKGLNYENINKIMGMLECVKQEFYRRVAKPYEDKKIGENGDV
jgi:hypothetical protein